MLINRTRNRLGSTFFFLLTCWGGASAQTTSFTYQGKLTDNGVAPTGTYQMQFALFAAASGGTPIGNETVTNNSVSVNNGIFTVELNFSDPNAFDGSTRWLEIAVKKPADPTFTTLANRQKLTSTPYAIKSLNAVNSTQLGGVAANQYVQTSDSRLSDDRNPLPNSTNYVQNTTSPQSSSNFNISGNGTAAGTLSGNIVNSTTQYNLAGLRVFSVNGGFNDGTNIFTAINTFAGERAGLNTMPNPAPTNSLGKFDSFFGAGAGQANTQGARNSFFGAASGAANDTGAANSFFGSEAGRNNTGGILNTFVGQQAGYSNVGGNTNTFIGVGADFNTSNPVGDGNTLLGIGTKVNSGVTNGSAIGGRALVAQSNALILGSINGVNNANADTNVGIGTTTPAERLHVVGNGLFTGNLTVVGTLFANLPAGSGNYIQNTTSPQSPGNFNIVGGGTVSGTLNGGIVNATTQFNIGGSRILSKAGTNNLFAGDNVGLGNVSGSENAYFGNSIGPNSDGFFNSFFGFKAGFTNRFGNNNAFFGHLAGRDNLDSGANSFFGDTAGLTNQSGNNNSFFGFAAGSGSTTGSNNAFFGDNAGFGYIAGDNNSLFGAISKGIVGIQNSTAIGYRAFVNSSNALVLGSINGINGCNGASNCGDTNVAIGTTNPAARLHISGTGIIRTRINSDSNAGVALTLNNQPGWSVATVSGGQFQIFNDSLGSNAVWIDSTNNNVGIGTTSPNDKLEVNGVLRVDSLGSIGGTFLCRNLSNQISNCSSSLRYKTNINPFSSGLNLVKRLSPITFNWKQGGMMDIGLGAEDVEKVEPLLVTYNDTGQVEGVKYERVGVVLINAIKEQQAQIENEQRLIQSQQKLIENQQRQIDSLKKLVCSNSKAEICKE